MALSSLLLFAWVTLGTTPSEPTEYWGIAKNSEGRTVYTEKHHITREDGALKYSETTYFDASREIPIGTLKSDYTKSLLMPTYEFVDLRSGYREGLRFSDGKYIVYFQEADEVERSEVLKEGESIFSCQGWHYYLVENLAILEKKDIALNLILPSALDFYGFQVEQVESSDTRVVANLKLSNWLLSFFAPKLRLVYDRQSKKLIEYRGVSNLLDEKGKRQEVTLRYEY